MQLCEPCENAGKPTAGGVLGHSETYLSGKSSLAEGPHRLVMNVEYPLSIAQQAFPRIGQ